MAAMIGVPNDRVSESDDGHAYPLRKTIERVAAASPDTNDRSSVPVGILLEHERPRHNRRSVRHRPPPKNDVPHWLEGEDVEAVRRTWCRWEKHAYRNGLKVGHDAIGASMATVVDEVVAVPSCSSACPHLDQPGPYLTGRAPNSGRMRKRRDRFRNQVVAGKRTRSFAPARPD